MVLIAINKQHIGIYLRQTEPRRIIPVCWPQRGPVTRLFLNIANQAATVFVHQTAWPRQPQNPHWRIEVTDIDGRYDQETQASIRQACEEHARACLIDWLKQEAPAHSIETVTWNELIQFARLRRFKTLSPYQKRRGKRMTSRLPQPSRYKAPSSSRSLCAASAYPDLEKQ